MTARIQNLEVCGVTNTISDARSSNYGVDGKSQKSQLKLDMPFFPGVLDVPLFWLICFLDLYFFSLSFFVTST